MMVDERQLSAPYPAPGCQSPFWSVMIPTYNPSEKFLRETLESLMIQDPGRDEMQICMVDDASPGGAPEGFVRAIAGGRIEIVRQPMNGGLAVTWNRCVSLAKGTWVHILHQDDILLPGFYSKLRELVTRYSDAGAAFTRHAFVRGDGHWQTISELHQSNSGPLVDQRRKIFSLQIIHCPAVVVAAQTYRDLGGFDPRFTHALDWDMWMRIAAQRKVLFEPSILAGYRVHSEATTARQTETAENFLDIGRVIRHGAMYLPPLERGPIARRALSYYSAVAFKEGWDNIWRRKFAAAAAQLSAARSLAPGFLTRVRIDFARLRLIEQRLRFEKSRQ